MCENFNALNSRVASEIPLKPREVLSVFLDFKGNLMDHVLKFILILRKNNNGPTDRQTLADPVIFRVLYN